MEGLLHYINPAHSISLLSALNEERLKGQLCDVLLIVGDQKFRAHKNVLAASSEYFQSLFTNKENEAQTVFQLDFCEPDAFDNVLNYIYSSSLFVEKGSLAAVQELGYSLGISFLTNIVAKAPQAPFLACPNRKRVPVDDDESGSQKRSVIVCQSRNEAQGKAISPRAPSPSVTAKSSTVGPPHVATSADPLHGGLSLAESGWPRDGAAVYAKRLSYAGSLDESRSSAVSRSAAGPVTTPPDREAGDNVPGASGQLPKGKAIELALKRPRPPVLALRSSSETPYLLKETSKGGGQGEDRNLLYYSTLGLVIPSSGPASARPAIDRSGPLVKSLLRRSLSMDSQVPVHSPSIDLKASQGSSAPPGDAPGKASSPKSSLKDACEQAAPDDEPQVPPPRLRSLSASQSLDREVASPVRVKTEPSSPPAEPSDIIRVTVVDTAVTTSDVPLKVEEDQTDVSRLPAKRRFQADRRSPFKKARVDEQGFPASEDAREDGPSPPLDGHLPDSDLIKEEFGELAGPRPNRKFKCKHCLKIFRSTAGLHRHVNMYHNPEKPYACDICHKRFHTNFKVWTHCQTQHGVVKNPSPASGSHAVLDERFQRKLIDIVREREIKKALVGKLRRSRPGFPGPAGSPAAAAVQQAIKRNLRSRAKGTYLCACCGKACRLLSQLKQHMRTHLGERGAGAGAGPRARAEAAGAGQGAGSRSQEVYPCRLCNAELSSLLEQGSHERLCRSAAVCPFCSLRFFSPALRREHEPRCEYRRLTCLECMRTFKSAFSIWRHQVEVHHQNSMAPPPPAPLNGEAPRAATTEPAAPREDGVASDSEDSCLPEDLSMARPPPPRVKEEPEEPEEAAAPRELAPQPRGPDGNLWPCEKCGKAFPAPRQLERHQELLCSVKPFICHVCHKAFRTNFRLWSHFQSHMAPADEPEGPAPAASPSPPPLPPPPPLPQIQPLEPDGPVGPDGPAANPDKLSDTLFYHAPPLSAITFKRQFMCKLCHRTFKTAFSLWSHEQTHN